MSKGLMGLATLAGLCGTLSGCATKARSAEPVVSWWGTHELDDAMQLKVSAVGMTQMHYELVDRSTDRVLVSDMGRDTRGWFFVWDDRGRLWGHWADLGTIVWVPTEEGAFEKHLLTPDSPLIREVPAEVSARLSRQ